MSELIVLGLIPGTHMQVTFTLWLVLAGALVLASGVCVGVRRNVIRNSIITLSVRRALQRKPNIVPIF